MRRTLQRWLMAAIALLEKEEPARPCVCIESVDSIHGSDCKVGPRRDQRLRWEEAAWVLEKIEDMLQVTRYAPHERSALEDLREAIICRWSGQ